MISVIGLGKMGLPFAVEVAMAGEEVTGCDVSDRVVLKVQKGEAPFDGEANLATKLKQVVSSGHLLATTETKAAVKNSSTVVVLVPVYVDEHGVSDFRVIDSVTRQIGEAITPGTLVTYETTLPVGTTRNRFAAEISKISGLRPGEDFFVAFSPERVSSGSVFRDLKRYPKLVGGINEASARKAKDFYEKVLSFDERPDLKKPNGVWVLSSSEEAELAKLAETTYRDVNIGLANQFAAYAESIGADIYEVIEACNSQPYSHIHNPGIAVGGHCIPVYPHMYLQGDSEATVVHAARAANKSVPARMIQLVEQELAGLQGKKIAILGLAYRAGVKEHAFSGALDLVAEAEKRGAVAAVSDPMYSEQEINDLGFDAFKLGDNCDAVILHTSHVEYQTLKSSDLPGARVLIDGRNTASTKIKSEIKTYVLGKGFDLSSPSS